MRTTSRHVGFWLAVHALEKYSKAILLLPGSTSKNYLHDIPDLYSAVKVIASDLLPSILRAPEGLETGRDKMPEDFVAYLYERGNPHNRYLVFGWIAHEQDIFMLDQMVFALRRLTCPLDGRAFPKHVNCDMTYRERLRGEPSYYPPLGMPLDSIIEDEGASPVRMAALTLNLTAFTPAQFEDTPRALPRFAFQKSVLDWRILDPLKSRNPTVVAIALQVADWCLKKVTLPPTLRKEIEDAVAAASKSSDLTADNAKRRRG